MLNHYYVAFVTKYNLVMDKTNKKNGLGSLHCSGNSSDPKLLNLNFTLTSRMSFSLWTASLPIQFLQSEVGTHPRQAPPFSPSGMQSVIRYSSSDYTALMFINFILLSITKAITLLGGLTVLSWMTRDSPLQSTCLEHLQKQEGEWFWILALSFSDSVSAFIC